MQCFNLGKNDFSLATFEVSSFLKISLVTLLPIQNKLLLRSLEVFTIATYLLIIFPVIAGDQRDSEAPGMRWEKEQSRASLGKTYDLAARSVQLFTHPVSFVRFFHSLSIISLPVKWG